MQNTQKDVLCSFSFCRTGLRMAIEVMTSVDKSIGIIEKKVITDMRRAFPGSESDFLEIQIAYVGLA